MNIAWRALWKRIKRQHPNRPLAYVRIVELHKSGSPHLHFALQAPYLPQPWLSSAWSELTGSPIVDIRAVRTRKGLAAYLAKYVTKSAQHVESRRKWSATAGYLPPDPTTPLDPDELPIIWRWTSQTVAQVLAAWEGYAILDHPPWFTLSASPTGGT